MPQRDRANTPQKKANQQNIVQQSSLRSEAPAFFPSPRVEGQSEEVCPPGFELRSGPPPPGFSQSSSPASTSRHNPPPRYSQYPSQPFLNQPQANPHFQRHQAGRGLGEKRAHALDSARNGHSENPRNEAAGRNSVSRRGRGRQPSWYRNPQQARMYHEQAQPSSRQTNAQMEKANNSTAEAATCAVCYEDLEIVSIGKCNHKEVCGFCCLRIRKQNDEHHCPLCKTLLKTVVIAQHSGSLPNWERWESQLSRLWHNRDWNRHVFIDDSQQAGAPRRARKISVELQALTGKICSVCDRDGKFEHPSYRSLLHHLEVQHKKSMCPVCLAESNRFPFEMELYTTKELAQHLNTHPRCDFCQAVFMDEDGVRRHVHLNHHICWCCLAQGRELAFGTYQHYWRHLVNDHFACQHPDCRATLTAFPTGEGLAQHRREEHSRSGQNSHSAARESQAARQASTRAVQTRIEAQNLDARMNLENGFNQSVESLMRNREDLRAFIESQEPSRAGTGAAGSASVIHSRQTAPQNQGRGSGEGLRMFDDDFGMTGEAFPQLQHFNDRGTNGRQDREELMDIISRDLAGSDALPFDRTEEELARGVEVSELIQQRVPQEAFPALPSDTNPSQGPQRLHTDAQPARPRLVSVTRRCPCGRRVDHPVVQEGHEVAPLLCDDVCEAVKRRAQLANAFGIEDPDSHIPAIDRNRIATHSPELLAYARQHRGWVQDVEAAMASFVRSKEMRQDLPAMPKTQRKIVHEMAPAFGLTTQSYGQEPSRHLRLFKGSNAGIPSNRLSKDAAEMSEEQISNALETQTTFVLHLREVDASADLPRMFSRWLGDCAIEGPDRNGQATVTFVNDSSMRDALRNLGGGIRGKFRIDRSLIPSLR